MQFSSTPKDIPSPIVTHASLSLASQDLHPDTVTSLLGIQPHRRFRCGDKYTGRDRAGNPVTRTRSSGLWALDSIHLISSTDPSDHACVVIDMIYPVLGRWLDLQAKGLVAHLCVTHAREESELGYTLDHRLLRKIADLRIDISIICNIIPASGETRTQT
jgi:hypothetical protein